MKADALFVCFLLKIPQNVILLFAKKLPFSLFLQNQLDCKLRSNQDIYRIFMSDCFFVEEDQILPEYSVTVDQNIPGEDSLWTHCSPCSSV